MSDVTIGGTPATIGGEQATVTDPPIAPVVAIGDDGAALRFDDGAIWKVDDKVIVDDRQVKIDRAILVEVEVNNLTVLRMQQSRFDAVQFDGHSWQGDKILGIADVVEGEEHSAARLSISFHDETIEWTTDPGALPVKVIWVAKEADSPVWEEVATIVGRVGALSVEVGANYSFEVTPDSALGGPVNDEVLSHDAQYAEYPGDVGLIYLEEAVNNYFEVTRAPREYGGLGVQDLDDILGSTERKPPAPVSGRDEVGVLITSVPATNIANTRDGIQARLSDPNAPTAIVWSWWVRDDENDTTAAKITGASVVTTGAASSLILSSSYVGKQVHVEVEYADEFNDEDNKVTLVSPWYDVR